ncbi:S-layer homology domain-containing protein [Romboutsia lituseburensis]|uniref:S-layer homology domain-containing protein n=1 Tax=Romboutsia lituseburensis TaxID=1537 RepID=UPI00215B4277|nr:S-layer homology domain-containing protein [Romboutsia lituseburensis]MCR8743799.1 S-layer homology domain-containing protein [Romboutsia lituseburensis]
MKYLIKKFSLFIISLILIFNLSSTSTVLAYETKINSKSNTIQLGVYKDDGAIYESLEVPYTSGDTAYSIIKKVLGNKVQSIGSDETIYVEAIDGLGEFDRGKDSGWNYSVNRVMPNYSAGIYSLKAGDEIIWHYTINLGKDIQKSYDRFDIFKNKNQDNSSTNNKPIIYTIDKEVKLNHKFDPMKDVKSIDKEDGDLTEFIKVISNEVNTSKEGTYKVIYEVTDSDGNKTMKEIKVKVANKQLSNVEFSDINNHWAKKQIEEFSTKGFIGGYSDNTFKPNKTITRAEFVKIINNVYGFKDKGIERFNDVQINNWFYDDVCKAVKAGYINGKSDNTFEPNQNITREEVAVILTNINKNKDNNTDKLNQFKDGSQTSTWAKSSVEGSIEANYVDGYDDNTIRPKAHITRAEAVTILSRVK